MKGRFPRGYASLHPWLLYCDPFGVLYAGVDREKKRIIIGLRGAIIRWLRVQSPV